MVKKQKQTNRNRRAPIITRITPFQIKVVISIIVLLLSYRYPLPSDGIRNQEFLTLFILSIFLITKPSPYHRLMQKFSYPKLMAFLIFITFIFPTIIFADSKYQDWDNAQLIKGLHRDFPILVEEIEQATGLELEQEVDCSITTEKFSTGVRTCELSVLSEGNSEQLETAYSIFKNSSMFPISTEFQNGEGYNATYRNKNSCSFRTQERIYSTCITAVREANIDLARELFLTN